jgi:RNA polymerase sigma-70 factor (ECF subfamily)
LPRICIAQLFYAPYLRYGSEFSVKLVVLNDEWALLLFFRG